MTKRTRTTVFILLGIFFIVTAPTIILFSEGYRFDWEEKRFSQVGAFYFSVVPTRTEIFVNDQSIGKTTLVLGTTLTKSFAPDTYRIRIQKQGYHSWEKQLEIVSKQVTEGKNITLVPLDPAFVVLQDNVLNFWLAPNKTDVLLQKSNSQNTWTLALWNTQTNLVYSLYESPRLQDEIQDVQWAPNSNSFLFHVTSREQLHSYVQRVDRTVLASQETNAELFRAAARLRISLDNSLEGAQRVAFSPFEETQLLFLGRSRDPFVLSQFDYETQQTLSPLAQEVVTFLVEDTRVIWLNQEGILWQQTDRNSQPIPLNETPFLPIPETLYTIYAIDEKFFLQENQTLYILNQQSRSFDKFFAPFHEMVLSPDKQKLALSTGKELWLHFLKEDREQPSRTEDERVFLTRFSEGITNLAWFTSHYLLFSNINAIVISEIDNRDRLNMVEIAVFPHSNLSWQDAAKTLLVQSGDQIRVSEKLLP